MTQETLHTGSLSSDAAESQTWGDEVNGALNVAFRSADRSLSATSVSTPLATWPSLRDTESPHSPSPLHDNRPLEPLETAQSFQANTPFLQVGGDGSHTEAPSVDSISSTGHEPFLDGTSTYNAVYSDSVFLLRPGTYLRKPILTGFILCFVALAIAVEVLLALSNHYQGLTKGYANLRFALKYGPTLVLTVVAALWSRVEFQAQMDAPWRRLSRRPISAEKSLLLDYMDNLAPKALWKGLMNRDWVVALSMVVSFLLIGTMLLSTTLLNLTAVPSSVPLSIGLQDRFVGNWSQLESSNLFNGHILITILGLLNVSITNYPEGTLNNIAYPRFRPRLDLNLDYHFTADGILFNVPCRPANLVSVVARPLHVGWDTQAYASTVWATIVSGDCSISIPLDFIDDIKYYSRYTQASCQDQAVLGLVNIEVDVNATLAVNTTLVNNVISAANATSAFNASLPLIPIRSSQIMCFPSYRVSQMEIFAFGENLKSISPLRENKTRVLNNVTVGDLMTPILSVSPLYCDILSDILPEFCLNNSSDDEFPPWLIIGALLDSIQPSAESMFNTSMLQSSTTRVFEQIFVFLASSSFIEPADDNTEGITTGSEDRVFVQSLSAHIITGLLVTSIILVCSLIAITRAHGHLPKSPANIIELAVMLCHPHSEVLRTKLAGQSCPPQSLMALKLYSTLYTELVSRPFPGGETTAKQTFAVHVSEAPKSKQDMSKNPSPSKLHGGPAVLRLGFRLAVALFTLAIVVSLEVSLHKSENLRGLADASQTHAWNYLWQLLPAVVFTLIRFYHSAVDFNIRALQPFHNMRRGKSFTSCAVVNILDMSLPSILRAELRTKSFAPLMTTLSRFIASFLTIFSASLFFPQPSPFISQCQLNTADGFKVIPSEFSAETERFKAFLFEGNATFPDFTFEDLVFPRLVAAGDQFRAGTNSSRLKYTSTVTALRPNLSCKLFDMMTNVTVDILTDYSETQITLEIGLCREVQTTWMLTEMGDVTYFGSAYYDDDFDCIPGIEYNMPLLFWGMAVNNDSRPLVSSMLVCKETLEEVDVDVSFFGPELRIDPALPPIARSNSTRASAVEINGTLSYYGYMFDNLIRPEYQAGSGADLSPPFPLFVESRFDLSLSALGDASRVQETTEAIKFQLRVLRAQAVNADQRVSVVHNATSTGSPEIWPRNGPMGFNATVEDGQGQQRIFQDVTSTRILQALLGTILVFSILGWALMPQAGKLLPHSATSVAETLAMLARGNIWEFLPAGAQEMNITQLESVFDGYIIRLENISTSKANKQQHKLTGKAKDVENPVYAIRVARRDTGVEID
ncbi:hypothetical protein F5Y10DRAFT_272191 [Nemania abortiva]|nr:hypothetical protein F5Y10DRAFT_272191 [Nemania abortiva]